LASIFDPEPLNRHRFYMEQHVENLKKMLRFDYGLPNLVQFRPLNSDKDPSEGAPGSGLN